MMKLESLFIAHIEGKGRSIFTNAPIAAETIIEVAPVIVMSGDDRVHLDKTLLHDYIFEWGEKLDKCAVALGWVSLYNHAPLSNCEYIMDYENDAIVIKTVKAINRNEELTINYNGEYNDIKAVWFELKS